jgi:hypothetical protein
MNLTELAGRDGTVRPFACLDRDEEATQFQKKELTNMASPAFKPTPGILPLTEEEIALRAHLIYLREGSVYGRDERNWFKAIEQLTAERQIESGKPVDSAPDVKGRMPSRAEPRGGNARTRLNSD